MAAANPARRLRHCGAAVRALALRSPPTTGCGWLARAVRLRVPPAAAAGWTARPLHTGAAALDDAEGAANGKEEGVKRLRLYTRTGDKGKSSLYNGKRLPKTAAAFAALGDTDELNAVIGVAGEHCRQSQGFLQVARAGSPYARAVGAEDSDEPGRELPGGGREARIDVPAQLVEIQSRLLDLGSCLATPLDSSSADALQRAEFDEAHVATLEKWIDAASDALPPLRSFILPVRRERCPPRACPHSSDADQHITHRRNDAAQSGGFASAHLHHARAVCRRAERSATVLIVDGRAPDVVGRYLNR